jgi:mannose-6-phosphate isomerase-like protein (cupin superfamily)
VSEVKENHLVFVPAGTKHNIKNIGSESLKLFTIYAPAEDVVGTLEETKPEE